MADTIYSDATDETTGTTDNDSATTLVAEWNDPMSEENYGHAYFDVYGTIGVDSTITACTLNFYLVSYTRDSNKPPTSMNYNTEIFDGTAFQFIEEDASYSSGATQHTITGLSYIGEGVSPESTCGSGYDTDIRFSVKNPTTPRYRHMTIASYENTSYTQPYLVVTYTPAAGGTTNTVIICC